MSRLLTISVHRSQARLRQKSRLESTVIRSNPDREHINTSNVERAHLTMRMQMRRFTRLTNAFSKKSENHCNMVAPYAVWYNFIWIHKTLRYACDGIGDRRSFILIRGFGGIVAEWEASR